MLWAVRTGLPENVLFWGPLHQQSLCGIGQNMTCYRGVTFHYRFHQFRVLAGVSGWGCLLPCLSYIWGTDGLISFQTTLGVQQSWGVGILICKMGVMWLRQGR